jgi:hypothetical protein
MTIEEVQALWRLGKLSFQQMEDQAAAWLEAGYDGPNLRELAWRHDSKLEIDRLLAGAVLEMGHAVMSQDEARMWCARHVAQQIVDGAIDAYEGAESIYWECWEFSHAEHVPPSVMRFYWLTLEADIDEHAEFAPSAALKFKIRREAETFLTSP